MKMKNVSAGKVSEFHAVKAGTKRAYLLSLLDGSKDIKEIATLCNTTPNNARVTIHCLSRDCGIGHKADADGKISAVFPKNKNLDNAVKDPNAAPEAPAKVKKEKKPAPVEVAPEAPVEAPAVEEVIELQQAA